MPIFNIKQIFSLTALIPALLFAQTTPVRNICGTQIFGEKNPSEARQRALASLAQAINSRISIRSITEEIIDEVESTQKDTTIQSISSELPNAHDAKYTDGKDKNGYSSKACMSESDAAKGFAERGQLVADSLDLVSHVLLNTKHPKRKNEAWNKTQTLWNEYARIQNLLEGWSAKPLASKTETKEKAEDDYKNYCKNMKIHWEDTGNQCSNAVFAKLSKKTSMEKSICKSGFKFRFSCEEKCESHAFGAECFFEPSLSVENCSGEKYSLLKTAKPATGSDMHNKGNAMKNLLDNLPKAAFFEQWEKEIMEWVPKCAD